MSKRFVSDKKASTAYLSLFLIGIGLLIWTHYWWPGIVIVFGLCVAVRQLLVGRHYDAWGSILFFGAITIFSLITIRWDIVLPVLFILSGFYIFFRDFLEPNENPNEKKDPNTIDIEIDDKK